MDLEIKSNTETAHMNDKQSIIRMTITSNADQITPTFESSLKQMYS